MSSKRTLLIIGLTAGSFLAMYEISQLCPDTASSAETPSRRPEQLVQRPWMEKWPTDDREYVRKLLLLETPEGRFGVTGKSSLWSHHYEVFRWSLHGKTLKARFPQHHVKDEVQVRTWSCKGEAPEPFDLCLEIRRGETQRMMYSRTDWVIRPQANDKLSKVPDSGMQNFIDEALEYWPQESPQNHQVLSHYPQFDAP